MLDRDLPRDRFFHPVTAYSRLDPLASTCVIGSTDLAPIWAPTLIGGAKGNTLLDNGTTNYLVSVRGTATYTLDLSPRFLTAVTLAAADPAYSGTFALDLTTTARWFRIKTKATNVLAVHIDPNALTDAAIDQPDPIEASVATTDNNGTDRDEDISIIQGCNGWMAISVSSAVGAGLRRQHRGLRNVNRLQAVALYRPSRIVRRSRSVRCW